MDGLGLTHIDRVNVGRIAISQTELLPVDAGIVAQQVLPAHLVDIGLRVAALHLVVGLAGYLVFDGEGCLHLLLSHGLAVANHLEEVFHQTLVGGHHCLLLLIGLGIVFGVKTDASLVSTEDVLVRVDGVLAQSEAEEHGTVALGAQFVHHALTLLTVLDGSHIGEGGLDGLVAHTVASHRVHIHTVKRTNLLAHCALGHVLLGIFLHEVAYAVVVLLVQIGKRTVHGVYGVEWMALEPAASRKLVEIFTGLDFKVHVGLVNAAFECLGRGHA